MLTQTEVMIITPEMARSILDDFKYEFQRQPKKSHVDFLADEMSRECFKQDTAIEFTNFDGIRVLTDGQHRLEAVVKSGTCQRFVVIDRYVSNNTQAAIDYTRTDQNRLRTVSESYKTLGICEELKRYNKQIECLGPAVVFIYNNFNKVSGRKFHPDIRLDLMRKFNESYGIYIESVARAQKEMNNKLFRTSTLSVALVTIEHSSKVFGLNRVIDFWKGAAFDDGLKIGDPRKTAYKHLFSTYIQGGSTNRSGNITVQYSSKYLALCFNAYVTGKKLVNAKPADRGIVILGSPFNGKNQ